MRETYWRAMCGAVGGVVLVASLAGSKDLINAISDLANGVAIVAANSSTSSVSNVASPMIKDMVTESEYPVVPPEKSQLGQFITDLADGGTLFIRST